MVLLGVILVQYLYSQTLFYFNYLKKHIYIYLYYESLSYSSSYFFPLSFLHICSLLWATNNLKQSLNMTFLSSSGVHGKMVMFSISLVTHAAFWFKCQSSWHYKASFIRCSQFYGCANLRDEPLRQRIAKNMT